MIGSGFGCRRGRDGHFTMGSRMKVEVESRQVASGECVCKFRLGVTCDRWRTVDRQRSDVPRIARAARDGRRSVAGIEKVVGLKEARG